MTLLFKTIVHAILILLLAVSWALVAFAMTHSWAAGDVAFWITAVLNYVAFLVNELIKPKNWKKEA